MTIDEAIKQAQQHIETANLPDNLAETAFRLVLSHLLAGGPAPSPPANSQTPQQAPDPAPSDGLSKVAKRTGVDASLLANILSFDGGELQLFAPSSRLAAMKSKATRELAMVVIAARNAAGLDDGWTSVEHVRAAASNYGKYDASNFSTTLRALDTEIAVKGRSSSTELRLTQPGWEAASKILRQMVGDDDA